MKARTHNLDPGRGDSEGRGICYNCAVIALTKCFIPERAGSAFKTPAPVQLFITNCLLNHKLFRRATAGTDTGREKENTAGNHVWTMEPTLALYLLSDLEQNDLNP